MTKTKTTKAKISTFLIPVLASYAKDNLHLIRELRWTYRPNQHTDIFVGYELRDDEWKTSIPHPVDLPKVRTRASSGKPSLLDGFSLTNEAYLVMANAVCKPESLSWELFRGMCIFVDTYLPELDKSSSNMKRYYMPRERLERVYRVATGMFGYKFED